MRLKGVWDDYESGEHFFQGMEDGGADAVIGSAIN